MRLIAVARRLLFHTPIGHSAFVARIYRLVFAAAAPDLTKPIDFRGSRFYVDPSDRTCVPGMVGGFYERHELDVFDRLVADADVCFDVGANVGVYSVLGCARRPELRSFAFEPVMENREILARNLALNGIEGRVSVEPVAISDHTGTATISLAASGTHSLSAQHDGATREVATLTLDEFFERSGVTPDIVKIDVEGHEAAALDGAHELLARVAPTVFMEFSPRQHRDLEGLLARLGATFPSCFMVDEISGAIVEMPIRSLDRTRDCNIVLTSKDRHLEALRALASRRRTDPAPARVNVNHALWALIHLARRLLFHSRLADTKAVGWAYRTVFAAMAPDLSAPVRFRDVSLYVDPDDRSYVPSVVGGYYEAKLLDIFEALVRDSSILFDLGANIGMYTVIGCRKALALRSWAFEPVGENRAILTRNLAMNNVADRVSLEPYAVSDRQGRAQIHLGYSGNHSLVNSQGSGSREIDTISLDTFIAEHDVRPDLLKLDVEGSESAVIDGASQLLGDRPPTTFMEFTPAAHGDVDGLVRRLADAFKTGFVVDEITGTVREVEIIRLDRGYRCNLILTSNDEHARTIRRFATSGG